MWMQDRLGNPAIAFTKANYCFVFESDVLSRPTVLTPDSRLPDPRPSRAFYARPVPQVEGQSSPKPLVTVLSWCIVLSRHWGTLLGIVLRCLIELTERRSSWLTCGDWLANKWRGTMGKRLWCCCLTMQNMSKKSIEIECERLACQWRINLLSRAQPIGSFWPPWNCLRLGNLFLWSTFLFRVIPRQKKYFFARLDPRKT